MTGTFANGLSTSCALGESKYFTRQIPHPRVLCFGAFLNVEIHQEFANLVQMVSYPGNVLTVLEKLGAVFGAEDLVGVLHLLLQ